MARKVWWIVVLVGCGPPPCDHQKPDCPTHSLRFSEIRATIFGRGPSDARSCTFSTCHSRSGRMGMLDLETDPYAALVNVAPDPLGAMKRGWSPPPDWRRVTPGSERTSFLHAKLTMLTPTDPKLGDRMPDTDQVLDCDSIAAITCWIRRGAPND